MFCPCSTVANHTFLPAQSNCESKVVNFEVPGLVFRGHCQIEKEELEFVRIEFESEFDSLNVIVFADRAIIDYCVQPH